MSTAWVDDAPVLIWRSALDRSTQWFSASWSAFTGRSSDELAGDGWLRCVHPEDVDRCSGIYAASFAAGLPFSLDVRLRRHDGDYRWMLDHGVPQTGEGDEPAGFIGTLVDIHERKEMEETLAERARQLRLADRRQGQFLATLSHELRNPLAPISNAASVLRTLEHTNPILVRLREILDRQAARLGQLIEELIDSTRAAQGQISIVRATNSVESFIQAAVASSHDRIVSGGHRLEVDLPDERLFIHGDSARLAQALAHLLGNAAKFTAEPGTVSISVRRVAKTVHVSVKDRGIGVSADFLPHAFELFSQQDQARSRRSGGLGVGLTLARRVAQLHGGDVEGFSDGPGQGSEFVMWLPLVNAPRTTDEDVAAQAAAGAPHLADSLRVLIVEDDEDALESLRLQIELWGSQVEKARSGAEAMATAAWFEPHIVLCDLGLPGMDGLELVEKMRSTRTGKETVFAAVTGYAGAEDQARAMAAGFDSFFVKPLDPTSLVRLMRSNGHRPA